MGKINKQNFLTELGRLLTFMYDEDRERALAMYSSLFDEVGDETGLLQLMGSPTRQAVNIARAYDARERKLQVQAQARGEEQETEAPGFVRVIEKLHAQAEELGGTVRKGSEEQASLFHDAEKETAIFDEVENSGAAAAEGGLFSEGPASGEEAPAPEAADLSPDASDVPAEPAEEENDQESIEDYFAEDAGPATAAEEEADAVPVPGPDPLPPLFEDDGMTADGDDSLPREDAPDEEQPAPAPAQQFEKPRSEIQAGSRPIFTRSKPRVALLILFLLFAIPITVLCVALLLIPAALTLGAGAFAGWVGVSGLLATFSSFSVFADILLVFGCTLIILALALLLLWIFIWLVFGAVPGLIRGVCALAHKWCYKEVAIS